MREKQAGEALSAMTPDVAPGLAEIISQFPYKRSEI